MGAGTLVTPRGTNNPSQAVCPEPPSERDTKGRIKCQGADADSVFVKTDAEEMAGGNGWRDTLCNLVTDVDGNRWRDTLCNPVTDVDGNRLRDTQCNPVTDMDGNRLRDTQCNPVTDMDGNRLRDTLCNPVIEVGGNRWRVTQCNPVTDVDSNRLIDIQFNPVTDVDGNRWRNTQCNPVTDVDSDIVKTEVAEMTNGDTMEPEGQCVADSHKTYTYIWSPQQLEKASNIQKPVKSVLFTGP